MLLSRLRRLLLTGSRSNSVHGKGGGQRATSVAFGGAGDALHPGAVRSNSTMGSAPGAGASSDLKSLGNAERDQVRARRKDPIARVSRAAEARRISEGLVGVLDGDAVVRHPSLVPAQQAPLLHRR